MSRIRKILEEIQTSKVLKEGKSPELTNAEKILRDINNHLHEAQILVPDLISYLDMVLQQPAKDIKKIPIFDLTLIRKYQQAAYLLKTELYNLNKKRSAI